MMYLWIMIGGAARYWCLGFFANLFGETFPWGTILVNILGSFIIGLVAGLTVVPPRIGMPPEVRIFLMTGICGGFTTFSAFSLQTLELMQSGEFVLALGYSVGSVVLCVIGTWCGWALGRG